MACSWSPIILGPNGPRILPIGLAASYGASGADVEYAFERGVNLFYWGSMRTPEFGKGLRAIANKSRDKVVTVIQTYSRFGGGVGRSLDKALRELKLDHTDILLLGWWNMTPPDRILDAAAELVHKGKAKYVMVSCHHRPTFVRMSEDPRIQMLMMRYNAAHPGAETDVFPKLPRPRPGIVAYTSTSWGELLDPNRVPPGERVPTSTDCYRFVLSSEYVDACYTGPKDRGQLEQALEALDKGPLSAEEDAWMRRVGASVRAKGGAQGKATNFLDRFANLVSGFGFRSTRGLPK